MERVIRHITEQFIEKLPSNREYYRPEDLQVLDIPEFVIERVEIEMDQNLNESLATPSTEWASMDADAVQFAWKNFIEAIKAEVRMPVTYAKSLFETAVAESLELALRPRQAIPESLFGIDKELTIDAVKKRVKYITIGRKLAAALVRYMEKKGKKKLTLTECIEIIAKVDEKLITGFNSLDWAKETEALFLMAGPFVDPELFRIYFEDRNKPKFAKKFDKQTKDLNRTQFIEILSTPDIEEIDEKPSNLSSSKEKDIRKKDDVHSHDKSQEKKRNEQLKDLFLPDDSILNSFQKRRFNSWSDEFGDVSEEEQEITESPESSPISDVDEKPLIERFKFDEEAVGPKEGEAQDAKPHNSIYDELNLKKDKSISFDEDDDEPSPSGLDPELIKKWKIIGGDNKKKDSDEDDFVLSEKDKPEDDDDHVTSIELYNETDDEEDVPMWRAFLEREDISKLKDDEETEESEQEASLADIFEEEPLIDLTNKEVTIGAQIIDIEKWIGDESDRFRENIFDGSVEAYEDALAGVMKFDEWKDASKYIQKEIFARNLVDVFDEVAVDFTDRLHTFFLEYKS